MLGNNTYNAIDYPDIDMCIERKPDLVLGQALIDFAQYDFKGYNRALDEINADGLYNNRKDKFLNTNDLIKLNTRREERLFSISSTIKKDNHALFLFVPNTVERILHLEDFEQEQRFFRCIDYLKSVLRLQFIFRFVVAEGLFINKNNAELTTAQRYNEVIQSFPEIEKMTVRKGISLYGEGTETQLVELFEIESFEEMMFFEFSEMLKRDLRIKPCKLCGKYFIVPDKRRHEFCDRIFKDNKTCKQVGSRELFDRVMSKDEVLYLYRREYNKIYSRMYRAVDKETHEFVGKDMSREEFKAWIEGCKTARQEYIDGKITGDELLAIVKKE